MLIHVLRLYERKLQFDSFKYIFMRNKAGHGKYILTPDLSCFENTVDPDQLAS